MNRLKTVITLLIIISMSLSISSCSATASATDITATTSQVDPTFTDNDHLTIIDMSGREVIFDKKIERVIAIGSALRLYTYVNGVDMLVGVEKAQQDPATGRPYIMANPELQNLPVIGEGNPHSPDPELLIEADPDVIIAGDIMDEASLRKLEAATCIPVVITSCGTEAIFDPETDQALEIIGKITGQKQRALDIINFFAQHKQELSSRSAIASESDSKSLYIGAVSFKGIHGIESTVANSPLVETIEARNVADSIGVTGNTTIDKEQLLLWDPDIIVIDANGLALVEEDYQKIPEFYNSLSAFKNNEIYLQLPYISYYSNLETALINIYNLGMAIYPEQFEDINRSLIAEEIYTFLLGKDLYEEMTNLFGSPGVIRIK